ncbi:MAG TPA: DUF1499 domain-containing protein [Gemmatimonadales bacterium]|nr:DUF1499 domain-containing protein [Gemmatimonadales bacterium]
MRLRWLVVLLAALAALLLLISGPGARLGLWRFGTGFSLMRWGAYVGIAAGLLAVALLLLPARGGPRLTGPLVAAVILGGIAAFVPWRWLRVARSVPPIHDITTDTAQPPEFVAVLPLRASAPNPAAYGGEEIAAQQHQAYPDIRPLELSAPPGAAFDRALAAARAAGWDVVATDSAAGRIEATATTGWFGFKDDVVVRVRPDSGGSRVDVRSVSRVGKSDVGTNARRIRQYLGRLAGSKSAA